MTSIYFKVLISSPDYRINRPQKNRKISLISSDILLLGHIVFSGQTFRTLEQLAEGNVELIILLYQARDTLLLEKTPVTLILR